MLAVVCLANGDGGVVLVGVDDDGTVKGAPHRHDDRTDPARTEALIANRTAPPLPVAVSVFDLDGKDVIVVEVDAPSGGLVATTSGRYLRRVTGVDGKPECLPMQPHETVARVTSLGDRDLSALPLPSASEHDLAGSELQRFRDLAATGGDRVLGGLSDQDLLSALGFRTVDGDLTVGALLCFGTESAIQRLVPTHESAFQVLDRLDRVQSNRIARSPLIKTMVDLVEAVAPYNSEEEVEQGLLRIGLPLYAEVSIRELVANALVHRDYSVNGQVRVALEDRTLTVSNPGGFPEGITIQNLLAAPPRARNPRLADAFKRAGLVERVGRGVNRVFRSQLALGRAEPDYGRSTREWVEVRLPANAADKELAAFVAGLQRSGELLDLRTLQVLHEVWNERRIASGRAGELLQVSVSEARAVLNELVERGLLEARGERKGRTYLLSSSLYRELGRPAAYVRTRGFDAIQHEQMVLTYVKEHDTITRQEAAGLCQLSPAQASSLLRRMRDDGRLQMHGARRTAHYRLGSGPSESGHHDER